MFYKKVWLITKFDKEQDRKNFKLELIFGSEWVGTYDFPKLEASNYIPKKLIPFNMAQSERHPEDKCIHFYIDDYQFERLWNFPQRYLQMLKRFEGVITTDFSMFTYMPKAQRIWNCYRNRVMAYWMQKNDINIIPVVEWSEYADFDWCLDGLPKQSVLSIGTYGCHKSAIRRYGLIKGVERVCRELEPKALICYGAEIQAINSLNKNVIWHDSYCKKLNERL